jgi:photosystem II stability/assembly factor-like uncharacterized protein
MTLILLLVGSVIASSSESASALETSAPVGHSAGAGQPFWRQLGPGPGEIDILAGDPLDPNVIYAASMASGLLYKTQDAGHTWTEVGGGFNGTFLTSISVSSTEEGNVYATAGANLFLSADGGATWNESSQCSGQAVKYVVDSSSPLVHLLACRSGLLISKDAGVTWQQRDVSDYVQGGVYILDATTAGASIFILAEAISEDQAVILKSDDLGSSWTLRQISATYINTLSPMAVSPFDPSLIFLTSGEGVLRSTDGGATWTNAIAEEPATTQGGFVAFNPSNSSDVYAGEAWLWKSSDSGRSFSEVANSTRGLCGEEAVSGDYHVGVTSLLIGSVEGRLYVGTEGGVYLSSDGGRTWECSSQGMKNAYVTVARADPFQSRHIVAILPNDGVYQTHDSGETWSTVSPPYHGGAVDVEFDPSKNGTAYFLSQYDLVQTKDGGETFKEVHGVSCPQSTCRLAFDPANNTVAWLGGGEDGLFVSTDSGNDWKAAGSFSYVVASRAFPEGTTVYLYNDRTSANCCVYKSYDSGKNWSEVTVPSAFDNFAVDPVNPANVFAGGNDMKNTIYVSGDGGNTFSSVRIPSDVIGGAAFPQETGGSLRLLLGGEGGPSGLYESYDCGESWTAIIGNANSTWVNDISSYPTSPNTILVSTRGGGILAANLTGQSEGPSGATNPCSAIAPVPEFGSQTLYVVSLAAITTTAVLLRRTSKRENPTYNKST